MTRDDNIARKRALVDARRPLPAAAVCSLDAWYEVELTNTSNAIEGSQLTRVETAVLLEKGLTVRGKPLSLPLLSRLAKFHLAHKVP